MTHDPFFRALKVACRDLALASIERGLGNERLCPLPTFIMGMARSFASEYFSGADRPKPVEITPDIIEWRRASRALMDLIDERGTTGEPFSPHEAELILSIARQAGETAVRNKNR
jgi:hypothetical protein